MTKSQVKTKFKRGDRVYHLNPKSPGTVLSNGHNVVFVRTDDGRELKIQTEKLNLLPTTYEVAPGDRVVIMRNLDQREGVIESLDGKHALVEVSKNMPSIRVLLSDLQVVETGKRFAIVQRYSTHAPYKVPKASRELVLRLLTGKYRGIGNMVDFDYMADLDAATLEELRLALNYVRRNNVSRERADLLEGRVQRLESFEVHQKYAPKYPPGTLVTITGWHTRYESSSEWVGLTGVVQRYPLEDDLRSGGAGFAKVKVHLADETNLDISVSFADLKLADEEDPSHSGWQNAND